MQRFTIARNAALVAALAAVLFCCGWAALAIPRTAGQVAQSTSEQNAKLEARLTELSGQTDLLARVAAESQERIVELPKDGGQFYVSVLLHKDWRLRPNERALVAYWHTDPRLVSIRVQTKWYAIAEDEDTYKRRFSKVTVALPAVYVQTPDGYVIHKQSGDAVCESADAVAAPMIELFKNRPWLKLPWNRPRPGPCPAPSPNPAPKPGPGPGPDLVIPVIPDTDARDDAKETAAAFPWLLLSIVVLVAAGGALAWNVHRAVNRV